MKKIAFVPDFREGNPYQDLLADALKGYGDEVSFFKYPKRLLPLFSLILQHRDLDVLHLHWIQVLIQRTQSRQPGIFFLLRSLLLIIDCKLVKLSGVKLVWTIHNKRSHEGFDEKRELKTRRLLFRLVDQVIVHSEEALTVLSEYYKLDMSSKTNVIPHGNYHGVYPEPSPVDFTFDDQSQLEGNSLVVLFFGNIKPYKGIETLIETFAKLDRDDIKLVIAGKVSSPEYQAQLTSKIENTQNSNHKNIVTLFRFLTDQELVNVIELSSYVCVPFADTLTSGSVLLAMTQGKAVILPEAGKVFGCVPQDGVNYFSNQNELISILDNIDRSNASKMGQANLQKSKQLDWSHIAKHIHDCYWK